MSPDSSLVCGDWRSISGRVQTTLSIHQDGRYEMRREGAGILADGLIKGEWKVDKDRLSFKAHPNLSSGVGLSAIRLIPHARMLDVVFSTFIWNHNIIERLTWNELWLKSGG